MAGTVKVLMALLSAPLVVAPGAWVAFTLLDRRVEYPARLAIAIALSPFVLAAEVVLLTFVGLDFSVAAKVTLLNVLALPLLTRRAEQAPPRLLTPVAIGCMALLAGVLVLAWTAIPNYRTYSWHNMMQAAVVYEVVHLPKWPEELDLAGFGLNYGWFGHVQIAVIGLIADLSPMVVYCFVNLCMLLAFFVLLLAAVARLRPGEVDAAALAVTLAVLTTNLAGILYSYVTTSWGEGRVSTLIVKFMSFDLMNVGEALFAGMVFLIVAMKDSKSSVQAWGVLALCATAIGFCYPLMFPPALLLAGVALLAQQVPQWLASRSLRVSREAVLAGAGLIAAGVVFAGYLKLLGAQAGNVARLATVREALTSVRLGLAAFAFWLPLLVPAAHGAWRGREPVRLTLLAAAVVLLVPYFLLKLPMATEYKILAAALLCCLPLAAEQWMLVLARMGAWGRAAGSAAIALIVAIVFPHFLSVQIPWKEISTGVPLDESTFRLAPASARELRWATAIRDLTPPDTVIVGPAISLPVSVFAQRASFVARDGGWERPRPGYTMPARFTLDTVKAYPDAAIAQRERIVRACFDEEPKSDAAYGQLTAELLALRRPVALYLPATNKYLAWLRAQKNGSEIYLDAEGAVWLIQVPKT